MVRSTAIRRRNAATAPTPAVSSQPAPEPVNKLTALQRRRVLAVLNSDRFVDVTPMKSRPPARRGRLPVSIATFYRVLRENTQVKERRRMARHPAKVARN